MQVTEVHSATMKMASSSQPNRQHIPVYQLVIAKIDMQTDGTPSPAVDRLAVGAQKSHFFRQPVRNYGERVVARSSDAPLRTQQKLWVEDVKR